MDTGIAAINERIKEGSTFLYRLREEIGTVIVGQRYMVERLLIGLLCNGHILLEAVNRGRSCNRFYAVVLASTAPPAIVSMGRGRFTE